MTSSASSSTISSRITGAIDSKISRVSSQRWARRASFNRAMPRPSNRMCGFSAGLSSSPRQSSMYSVFARSSRVSPVRCCETDIAIASANSCAFNSRICILRHHPPGKIEGRCAPQHKLIRSFSRVNRNFQPLVAAEFSALNADARRVLSYVNPPAAVCSMSAVTRFGSCLGVSRESGR